MIKPMMNDTFLSKTQSTATKNFLVLVLHSITAYCNNIQYYMYINTSLGQGYIAECWQIQ